jgi:hypothetical protein
MIEAQQQAKFEGWAIVEQMGHNRYAGFVTTEYFGGTALFRIDVPALEERERTTKRPEYDSDGRRYLPAGATVKESAVQGYTKYIGPSSLFALTPCSQAAVLAAIEEIQPRAVMAVTLPERAAAAIAAGEPVPHIPLRFHGDGDPMDQDYQGGDDE